MTTVEIPLSRREMLFAGSNSSDKEIEILAVAIALMLEVMLEVMFDVKSVTKR